MTSRYDKKSGGKRLEKTGNFAASRFTHFVNRSGEPGVHDHLTIANATKGSDGQCYAIEEFAWTQKLSYLKAVYRDTLASEAIKAGYEISTDQHGCPQIRGLEDLVNLYSQRSMDVAELVSAAENIVGNDLSDAERKRLTMSSRGLDLIGFRAKWDSVRDSLSVQYLNTPDAPKARRNLLRAFENLVRSCADSDAPEPVETDSLIEGWRTLCDPEQLSRLMSMAGTQPSMPPRCVSVQEAVDWSVKHSFERLSVVPRWQLMREALRFGMGANLDLSELRNYIDNHAELLHRGEESTTRAHYAKECETIRWIEECNHNQGVRIPKIKATSLTDHQRIAVNELLASTDRFQALIGLSGSGKTQSTDALIKANTGCGFNVLALAPSTKSRDVIDHEERHTLQRFLVDKKLQSSLSSQDLIVLDEAGLSDFESIHHLMSLCLQRDWRLLMVGDPRQGTSVLAGDGLRVLLDRTDLKREWLSDILRQRPNPLYLKAIRLFSQGHATKAFALLDRMKVIYVLQGQQRIDAIADAYIEEIKAGRSCMVCQPSHRENDAVSLAIRERLKREGLISLEERTIQAHRTLGLTLAERQNVRSLRIGWIIEVMIGQDKGRSYEIRQIDQQRNVAFGVSKEGLRMKFDKGNAVAWQACQRLDLKCSVNDKLLTHSAMREQKGAQVQNGRVFTVAGFTKEGCPIAENGDIIETKSLSHAYCSTTARSQGDSADTVLFGSDRRSISYLNAKMSYIGCSRGRAKIGVYVEDKSGLLPVESKKGERVSSVEMIKFCLDLVRRRPTHRIKERVDIPITP